MGTRSRDLIEAPADELNKPSSNDCLATKKSLILSHNPWLALENKLSEEGWTAHIYACRYIYMKYVEYSRTSVFSGLVSNDLGLV